LKLKKDKEEAEAKEMAIREKERQEALLREAELKRQI